MRTISINFGYIILQFHHCLSDLCVREAGVDLSACDGFMAEKGGYSVDIHSVFQEAHSEGMAETMKGYVLLYLRES